MDLWSGISLPSFGLTVIREVGGDVGNQPLFKGDLLDFSRKSADILDETVHFKPPDSRSAVQLARQRPMEIKLPNLEHVPNQLRFTLSRAFGNGRLPSEDVGVVHRRCS